MKLMELETTLLDQIEKLNDDSIAEDEEATIRMIERSKAINDLSDKVIRINELKVKAIEIGYKTDGLYDKQLGLELK